MLYNRAVLRPFIDAPGRRRRFHPEESAHEERAKCFSKLARTKEGASTTSPSLSILATSLIKTLLRMREDR